MPSTRQPIHDLYAALAVLPAMALMYFGASCGLLLTPDSEQYLSAALEINTPGRWPGDPHSTYLHWPPLFPIILSVFEEPTASLIFLHLAILVAIGFLHYRISFHFINNNRIRIAFVAISLMNVHLLMTGIFLWSELVFTLLMMLSLFCFFKAREHKRYFILLIISLALLCLQRYAGLLVTLGISIGFLIHKDQGSLKQRLHRGAYSLSIPAVLVFAWWCYVSHHHPEIIFLERFSISVAANNLFLILQLLSTVFLPVPGAVGAVLLVVVAGVVTYRIRTQFNVAPHVQHVAVVIVCYLSGFVLLGDLNADEADRFISAILPLVMLIGFFAFDVVYGRGKKQLQIAMMLFAFLWTTYPLYRSLKNVHQWHERSCDRHDNAPDLRP